MDEKILCAAIHNPVDKDLAGNPLIYCGLRHHNCLHQSTLVSKNPRHQGFLTNKGRFVDRKEGAEIAYAAKQIWEPKETLYSEDLY